VLLYQDLQETPAEDELEFRGALSFKG